MILYFYQYQLVKETEAPLEYFVCERAILYSLGHPVLTLVVSVLIV